ncbi:MAG: YigZ family protein [Helicobacteraceae bacterium]|nr:YigZ family protein [Helicobacteraceae bacterium]
MESLYYPLKIVESSFEVKGSCFISFLVGIAQFDNFIQEARQKHQKAVHFVNASRYFNEFGQIVESFSDDGEPKGTSGMPTLKVLRGYELVECGILIVRYFGGTLLGTGGLVRAYTQGAKDVVLKAKEQNLIAPFEKQEIYSFEIAFSLFSQVEYLAKKLNITLNKEFLESGVKIKAQAKGEILSEFKKAVESLGFKV